MNHDDVGARAAICRKSKKRRLFIVMVEIFLAGDAVLEE